MNQIFMRVSQFLELTTAGETPAPQTSKPAKSNADIINEYTKQLATPPKADSNTGLNHAAKKLCPDCITFQQAAKEVTTKPLMQTQSSPSAKIPTRPPTAHTSEIVTSRFFPNTSQPQRNPPPSPSAFQRPIHPTVEILTPSPTPTKTAPEQNTNSQRVSAPPVKTDSAPTKTLSATPLIPNTQKAPPPFAEGHPLLTKTLFQNAANKNQAAEPTKISLLKTSTADGKTSTHQTTMNLPKPTNIQPPHPAKLLSTPIKIETQTPVTNKPSTTILPRATLPILSLPKLPWANFVFPSLSHVAAKIPLLSFFFDPKISPSNGQLAPSAVYQGIFATLIKTPRSFFDSLQKFIVKILPDIESEKNDLALQQSVTLWVRLKKKIKKWKKSALLTDDNDTDPDETFSGPQKKFKLKESRPQTRR